MSLPLCVRGLTVTAPGNRMLLTLDALDIAPGALIGVRGPSGAGKTTLLHALAGLIRADGALRWGGTDLADLSEPRRTAFRGAQMGLIFQDFLLFEELSAFENAAIGASFLKPRIQIRARAAALMERLGVAGLADRPAALLSGGERQRVAVVRALAHDPAVLLADEPTASLDRANADALITDLVALAREHGRTVVMVSHDESALAVMDDVLALRDGKLEQPHD